MRGAEGGAGGFGRAGVVGVPGVLTPEPLGGAPAAVGGNGPRFVAGRTGSTLLNPPEMKLLLGNPRPAMFVLTALVNGFVPELFVRAKKFVLNKFENANVLVPKFVKANPFVARKFVNELKKFVDERKFVPAVLVAKKFVPRTSLRKFDPNRFVPRIRKSCNDPTPGAKPPPPKKMGYTPPSAATGTGVATACAEAPPVSVPLLALAAPTPPITLRK